MPTAEQTPSSSSLSSVLDLTWVRAQFPALAQKVNGQPAVFLDGPGGTQVPQRVIDAIADYLARNNANTGGAYLTSRNTDRMIAEARSAMGGFLNCDADEIVFGPNMTTLTYAMSRALGRDLGPGDEIVLTLLDHDANFSPWKALEEKGVTIRTVKFNEEDCTLDMQDLAAKIGERTKLMAVGYASNAVGTINNVAEVVRLARQAGALSYIDAVHYAPHGAIDVRALDCDFLVCSTYKFFGPHMGVLYGKREHLKHLRPYRVRPNTQNIPNCWEWGTLNHECIAGIKACVDYWEALGRRANPEVATRRAAILAAHEATHRHAGGSGIKTLRHQRCAALRESLRNICGPHRRPHPAGAGNEARRARPLHLGWKLLRAEPHRAVRCREAGRISAHRTGALQRHGGSGTATGGAAGDCEWISAATYIPIRN
jgi:cysteine desulfurase family protein (TIGR01976 family)